MMLFVISSALTCLANVGPNQLQEGEDTGATELAILSDEDLVQWRQGGDNILQLG